MQDYATDAGVALTEVIPLAAGLDCENYTLGRLNWLFQQLFAAQTNYTDCNGVPVPTEAQIATCANLAAAIDAAIAALPADKFLQGLQSYNAATNVLVLLMNDGSTVSVDMTALLADAVAGVAVPDGSETIITATAPVVVSGSGTAAAPYVIGLNMTALITALCGNTDFQACVASIAGGGGPVPIAPSAAGPWTLSGTTGVALSQTNGTFAGTAPIALTVAGLPAGVTFTDNGDGTFTLGGVFPAVGTTPYTVTATNVAGSNTGTGSITATAVATTPITATFTYAPTVDNPGGADPSVGSQTELLDAPGTVGPGEGLNKGLFAVVSNIQGGDGGPYTVSFAGLPWEIQEDGLHMDSVAVFWGLNLHNPDTGIPGQENIPATTTTTAGVASGAAVVTGVAAVTDYATFIPQIRIDRNPTLPSGIDYMFRHEMGPGTVTITDSSSNSLVLTAPLHFDDWLATGTGSPL